MLSFSLSKIFLFLVIFTKNFIDSYAQSTLGKNYSIVLVGGGLDDKNTDIWNKIIELGGGKGKARIGVITAASESPCCDNESSFAYYNDMFTSYGASEVYFVPITVHSKEKNADPMVIAHIKTLTGFFFSGGDQSRIIYSFYNVDEKIPSPALVAIRETLLATGGVVAGTSAGTDCQTSNVMISGGMSYSALLNRAEIFWRTIEFYKKDNLTAYGPGGIGLFPYGLLDTHFANMGRQGRLIQLLLDSRSFPAGSLRAYGVDENTALVVTGDWANRIGTVIGQRGVSIYDITESNTESSIGSISAVTYKETFADVRATRLSDGDFIDFNSMKVQFAAYKTRMQTREKVSPVAISEDIFNEGGFEFDGIARSLFQSTEDRTYGRTAEVDPKLIMVLSKDKRTVPSKESKTRTFSRAAGFDGFNPSTGAYAYSYSDLWIAVGEVKVA